MRTIQGLFKLAMKRDIPQLIDNWEMPGLIFDIGASGRYKVDGATALGLPQWWFPGCDIPSDNNATATIHCYHFLEHLSGSDVIRFLREVERVLRIDGVMNFCVPYYNSNLMAQDLTHRSAWCEDSFRNLFENTFYDPAGRWRLRVHTIFIMGIVERNLALIGQIVKV